MHVLHNGLWLGSDGLLPVRRSSKWSLAASGTHRWKASGVAKPMPDQDDMLVNYKLSMGLL